MFVLEICGNTDGRGNINGHESQQFFTFSHAVFINILLTRHRQWIYIYFLHAGLDKKYTLSYISFASCTHKSKTPVL